MRILFIAFLFTASVTFSQTLIPFHKNKKYGYCNAKKEIVIKPQFEKCGFFSDGLAWFSKNNKEGYIDTKGKVLIPPKFETFSNFKYGTAIFADEEGGDICIYNKLGNKISTDSYAKVVRVADSLIACQDVKARWKVINNKNQTQFQAEDLFDVYWNNPDYFAVYNSETDVMQYLDLHSGKIQKEVPPPGPNFQNPDSLHLERNYVTLGGLTIEKAKVTDKNGKVLIPEGYESLISINNFEYVFCMKHFGNQGVTQIYNAKTNKISQTFPYYIESILFDETQEGESVSIQKMDGKYYFLCTLEDKMKADGDFHFVCIDEEGVLYGDK